jgi:hypothetical protein
MLLLGIGLSLQAGDLDMIGVTLLRQFDPTLQGAGVRVAQVEGEENAIPPFAFEVNPAKVGQPTSLFTWISALGSVTTFTNIVGIESTHANTVAANYYGVTNGTAPQVAHVYNYDASHFYNDIIAAGSPPAIPVRIVNQSFIFPDPPFSEAAVNQNYDDYAVSRNTIFISGVGNFGVVSAAGTCYNGIGPGTYGAATSFGPSTDGRCKPDLVAPDAANFPAGANSYAITYVSASAAILVQAGGRGDGGANTGAATNLLTIKALLLNGAVKTIDWTNSITTPLDARYGAGLVNVFNSWTQLKGGKRPFIESSTNSSGGPHPPGLNPGNVPVLIGWDTNSISTPSGVSERVNHYYFNLTGGDPYALTATLVWNRQQGQSLINNLDLFLYNTANSNLIASSVSSVDNVEHLYLPRLSPGRYDLQVLKKNSGQVSNAEGYALAFEMISMKLKIVRTNNNLTISWPAAPTGFRLLSASSLNPPVTWAPVAASVVVDTNTSQNSVSVPIGTTVQFFRLQRP